MICWHCWPDSAKPAPARYAFRTNPCCCCGCSASSPPPAAAPPATSRPKRSTVWTKEVTRTTGMTPWPDVPLPLDSDRWRTRRLPREQRSQSRTSTARALATLRRCRRSTDRCIRAHERGAPAPAPALEIASGNGCRRNPAAGPSGGPTWFRHQGLARSLVTELVDAKRLGPDCDRRHETLRRCHTAQLRWSVVLDTARKQGRPLALGLHFGGELTPCVLAEDQNRSQRVL
jgi:hypothetical protein